MICGLPNLLVDVELDIAPIKCEANRQKVIFIFGAISVKNIVQVVVVHQLDKRFVPNRLKIHPIHHEFDRNHVCVYLFEKKKPLKFCVNSAQTKNWRQIGIVSARNEWNKQ